MDNKIIKVLETNANELARKAELKNREGDTKGYIDIMRALRDTLDLIFRYGNKVSEEKCEWNSWYYMFYISIKSCKKNLVYLDYKTQAFRGSGKSYAIAKLAKEYNIPIFCRSKNVPMSYDENDVSKDLLYTNINNMRGLNRKMVLVDEIDIEKVIELEELGFIVIGFCLQ